MGQAEGRPRARPRGHYPQRGTRTWPRGRARPSGWQAPLRLRKPEVESRRTGREAGAGAGAAEAASGTGVGAAAATAGRRPWQQARIREVAQGAGAARLPGSSARGCLRISVPRSAPTPTGAPAWRRCPRLCRTPKPLQRARGSDDGVEAVGWAVNAARQAPERGMWGACLRRTRRHRRRTSPQRRRRLPRGPLWLLPPGRAWVRRVEVHLVLMPWRLRLRLRPPRRLPAAGQPSARTADSVTARAGPPESGGRVAVEQARQGL